MYYLSLIYLLFLFSQKNLKSILCNKLNRKGIDFLKKFVLNNKMPSRSRSSERPAVILPPGVSPAAVGINDTQGFDTYETLRRFGRDDFSPHPTQLMGEDFDPTASGMTRYKADNGLCASFEKLHDFLCGCGESYIELEIAAASGFVKKGGILAGVGDDFVALLDLADGSTLICPLREVRLIRILGN